MKMLMDLQDFATQVEKTQLAQINGLLWILPGMIIMPTWEFIWAVLHGPNLNSYNELLSLQNNINE